ncbi:cyanophycin synthetase [Clostridium sp. 19966]|uniref:cyanophycin synthetase n=1 Tax=Clostridium sp. 19966 TaxID=2768166 RepID=UPI0028DD7564|nr:cyanophycin synthetase [Clostridium sp. 19966]MDT8715616.1 cyanophycin synthetase [Clostridium sp. 19966]
MRLENIRIFEGRNIYSHRKCIRADVDLEGYEETPSKDIDEFNRCLIRMIPELSTHRCGIDEDSGFIKRLMESTYLAHICEHITIALQNIAGIDVSYGKAREIQGPKYYIIFEYRYRETALKCFYLAMDIVNKLIGKNDKLINFDDRIKNIKRCMIDENMGTSTEAICNEAKKRGIPVMKLGETGLVQLGLGKYGKIIESTICENTGTVAVDISCDKMASKEILRMNGIPVSSGFKINDEMELLDYSRTLGYPLVLKPQFGNHGKGVITNILKEEELLKAYNKLKSEYKDIILENHIYGNDYRVCVVDGKVEAAALRIPPFVVGDGLNTIKGLIDNLNHDPRRGCDHEKPLTRIKIDEEVIAHIAACGYKLHSVLEKGTKIYLRGNANISTGGIAIDCTDIISDENKELCVRAAEAVGLNICGIDLCCKDIKKSLLEQGVVLEINASPGIRMHHYPSQGKPRNVSEAIVNMMFKYTNGNIPIISVTGTNGKTTTTRLIAHTMSLAGYHVGMTVTGGIYINNECVEKGDTTGFDSAKRILINRNIDAAVLECARGGIIRRGLAYDLADVGIITNITGDHIGLDGIKNLKDLASVKSLVVEAVKEEGYAVINGDDTVSVTLIDRIKSNLVVFSMNKENEIMKKAIRDGGIGVYLCNEIIYASVAHKQINIINVNDIPIAYDGKLRFNIENCLASIAGLIGIGIDYNIIAKGLKTFRCDESLNPARFNMFNVGGIKVILDYGHNIEGYKSVVQALKSMKENKVIGVIGVPGDRKDEDINRVGEICAEGFDYIYIKEDKDRRGRRSGEVAKILEDSILDTKKISRERVEIELKEEEAFTKAIDNANPKDIVIVFLEEYEPLLNIVKSRIKYEEKKEKIMA